MASVPGSLNRNPMPGITTNPEMANAIDGNPVFSSIAQEVLHDREVSAMKHSFMYHLSGEVSGQTTQTYQLLIEQGADFKCYAITGSCYSYDTGHASSYPIPNAAGTTSWAGRGLAVQLTDTRSGRRLTSGFVPIECLFTPGYGQTFQQPLPFRYFFYRNTKLQIEVRNRDNINRAIANDTSTIISGHQFELTFHGFKIYTPE